VNHREAASANVVRAAARYSPAAVKAHKTTYPITGAAVVGMCG
jgi:hypothetical protein